MNSPAHQSEKRLLVRTATASLEKVFLFLTGKSFLQLWFRKRWPTTVTSSISNESWAMKLFNLELKDTESRHRNQRMQGEKMSVMGLCNEVELWEQDSHIVSSLNRWPGKWSNDGLFLMIYFSLNHTNTLALWQLNNRNKSEESR